MTIVFLTNEYSHEKLPPSGGVGTFLKVIVKELDRMGHRVHVFGVAKKNLSFHDGNVAVVFRKGYFKRYPLAETARSVSASLRFAGIEKYFLAQERKYIAAQLKGYANQHAADIIETHAFNGYSAFWDNSIPLVVRFHGSRGFWHRFLGKKPDLLKQEFEKKALDSTPYLVAVSQFSARAIREIYGIDTRVHVINNGIDIALFSPSGQVPEIPQSVFYVGTLSDAKGLPALCGTFNRIIEAYPAATLHLVGKGQEYFDTCITVLLSAKALQQTVYHGSRRLEEIPGMLEQASVCIFPSLNENFPFVYLEAMAMQKVVVSSANEVAGEIITHGENGFITGEIEDYAAIVKMLFEDKGLKDRVAANARQAILQHFTKEAMARKTIEYYNSVLGR